MPSLDGGHYFLTVLAPIRTDFIGDAIPGRSRSHNAQLAQALASLPTGQQTAASPPGDPASPFSRNTLNHFARFVIVDGPAFNGRTSTDTLIAQVKGIDPLVPGPVDRFANPYLLFAADFDAQYLTAEQALRAYTDALWLTMEDELRDVLGHCVGFDTVTTADAFYDYIACCEIETTMPFNDYWPNDELKPKVAKPGAAPRIDIATAAVKAIGVALAIAVIAWVLALLVYVGTVALGSYGPTHEIARWIVTRIGIGLLAIAIIVPILLWLAYRYILKAGAKPFPTAKKATLPSILKSLYLQRHLSRFAIDAQGLGAADLHAAFGKFLAETEPGDEAKPTQSAGALDRPL